MPISHSFSVLMCNFKLVGKLFFFILIVTLIATALFISLLSPIFLEFSSSLENGLDEALSFSQHPFKSSQRFLEIFTSFIGQNAGTFAPKFLTLFGLLVALRFFITLCLMPISKILHNKMTTGFDIGFNNSLVSTLTQNLLFSLLASAVLTLVDIGITIAVVYFMVAAMRVINLFGVVVAIMLAIMLYSARMALVSMWLPEMNNCDCKNIFKSFPSAMKVTFKQFSKNYICILVINILFYSLIMMSLIPTIGLLPIALIPSYLVLYTALCNALNYNYYHKKYFIDNGVTVYQSVKKY